LVNFHFDFGGFAPVNSNKCYAGMRQRPLGDPAPLGTDINHRRALEPGRWEPQRNCTISTPCSCRRNTGAVSVGQMSSRGSRFGAAVGKTTGARIWLKAARCQEGRRGTIATRFRYMLGPRVCGLSAGGKWIRQRTYPIR
jgi:hypothetical protein